MRPISNYFHMENIQLTFRSCIPLLKRHYSKQNITANNPNYLIKFPSVNELFYKREICICTPSLSFSAPFILFLRVEWYLHYIINIRIYYIIGGNSPAPQQPITYDFRAKLEWISLFYKQGYRYKHNLNIDTFHHAISLRPNQKGSLLFNLFTKTQPCGI